MMKSSQRRSLLTVIMTLLVTAAIAVVGYNAYKKFSSPMFDDGNANAETNISKNAGKSFNALLIGTDAGGYNTDAIMIVRVDRETGEIHMLSIPRDTRVSVDGKRCKINSCYYTGGISLLAGKIRELTDIEINYYAIIQPGTLAQIVDCLDGVDYNVESDMHYSDPSQDLYIDLKAGQQTLNGDQAEQYCRYRSYLMGDITRTQCQQKFFKALFEQKLNVKYATKINEIYDIISENVKTNVSLKDIMSNISVLQMIGSESSIRCFETPGTYNDMKKDGVSYYLIEDEYVDELKKLCAEYFGGSFSAANES